MEKDFPESIRDLYLNTTTESERTVYKLHQYFTSNKIKVSKKIFKQVEITFNWIAIQEYFNKQYYNFYSSMKIPVVFEGLGNNKTSLERSIKRMWIGFIYKSFINILANFKDIEIVRKEIKLAEKEGMIFIDEILRTLYYVTIIDKIPLENDINKIKKDLKYLEVGKKLSGRNISDAHLKAYEQIIIKNDEFKLKYEKDNYRRIAFIVARSIGYDNKEDQERLYKNFNQFKNTYKIKNHKTYLKFISVYR